MNRHKLQQILQVSQRGIFLLIMIIIMAILLPGMFLTKGNILSILLAVCIYGLMVCGTIFPVINGNIDLSMGSVAALSGCVTVLVTIHYNYTVMGTIIGILFGLVIGIICGLFNGAIAHLFSIPSFVVTLASQNIIFGIAQFVTKNYTISCLNSDLVNWIGTGKILGVPFPIILFLIVFVLTYIVLNRTPFGRYTYATGGNVVASRFSGIQVRKIGITSFVISSSTAAMAGIVLACFNRQAVATMARGYVGDVLVALVVGGVSVSGGEGSIQGALFGILLMGILNNAMVLLGVDSIYQQLVKGIIITAAVSFDMYLRYKNDGLTRKRKLTGIFSKLK